jgi:REP element-mobilizing transposase RayT
VEHAYWLLTWTTYGTRLPGDPRGFVSTVRNGGPRRVRHNTPQTPMARDLPGLRRVAAEQMRERPFLLTRAQANLVAAEFVTTADVQAWPLVAFAVMRNHVHLVVGLPPPGDTHTAADAVRRLKAFSSRKLNEEFGGRARWWTRSGSRRLLPREPAVIAATRYVAHQPGCLVSRVDPDWRRIAQL